MKTNLLIALLLIATVSFAQNKQESKTDEKPLRKIASGRGAEEINEEVRREVEAAMKEVRIELKELDNLDIKVNVDVARQLEGLDELIEKSLEGLDVIIENSVEQSLKSLDHLDIDIDIDDDDDNFDSHKSIEEFRKEALRDDSKKDELKKDEPKKAPKKKE